MYCCSRPSQARPGRQLVELQSSLGLGEELKLLDWLLLVACAKGLQTLKNKQNSKFCFRAALPLEQF